MDKPQSNLPPGFRFHPTDEELILHYLRKKMISVPLPVSIITEVDIYKFDPWDLPAKAAFGEKEWYFFSHRDRKYPNGARPNRSAGSGYWKATGTDKAIVGQGGSGGNLQQIGVKKALVFYARQPSSSRGTKTNWIMHEYRLVQTPNYYHQNNSNCSNESMKLRDASMGLDDWVLCRIYKKPEASNPSITEGIADLSEEQDDPLPGNSVDYSILNHLLFDEQPYSNRFEPSLLLQRLPPLSDSLVSMTGNPLKRRYSNMDENILYQQNKLIHSCSLTNSFDQFDTPQYNLTNQPLFDQNLILSPRFQSQG